MKPVSMRHTGHSLLLVGVLLLLLALVAHCGGWTRLNWPLVAAQVQDVQVVRRSLASDHSNSAPQWVVQYAYKYVWEGREYLNRDLISHTPDATGVIGLTSQEYEYWLLRQGPDVWEPIKIWVNPKHPAQSLLYHAPTAPSWLMAAGALLCVMWLVLRLR